MAPSDLRKMWFPEKGQPSPRPNLVRGTLYMQFDRESGVFTCTAYIGIGTHQYSVQGFGHTGEEALEAWCLGAEVIWQTWVKNQVRDAVENGGVLP